MGSRVRFMDIKTNFALLFCSIVLSMTAFSQTQISGKVIDYFDLKPIPGVKIQTEDSLGNASTDVNGQFVLESAASGKLTFLFLGMEPMHVNYPAGCSNLEVVMIPDGTYDYMSAKKINKKRKNMFDQLPSKHRAASVAGTFTSDHPCLSYAFAKY